MDTKRTISKDKKEYSIAIDFEKEKGKGGNTEGKQTNTQTTNLKKVKYDPVPEKTEKGGNEGKPPTKTQSEGKRERKEENGKKPRTSSKRPNGTTAPKKGKSFQMKGKKGGNKKKSRRGRERKATKKEPPEHTPPEKENKQKKKTYKVT